MPVPSLTDLFTPKSQDDLVAAFLEVATDVELPVTAWQPQSVIREFAFIICGLVSQWLSIEADAAGGGLLDYSKSDWLTLLAFELYGIARPTATFASTSITLTNSSGTPYTFQPGDLVGLKSTAPSATYTSETGGFLPGNGSLTVDIVADQSGTLSNANTGDINALVSPIQGVSVTNANPAFGNDQMSDSDLVALCRASMAKASPNGPKDAYRYFAQTATRTDGKQIGVTQVVDFQGNGSITVYLASASGAADPDDVVACNNNIQANCVPTGFTATVVSAVALPVDVQATLYLRSGSTYSTSDAQNAALAALSAYFETIPIGGFKIPSGNWLFVDALIGQLYASIPGDVVQVVVTSPAADVAVSSNQVLVLTSIATDFTVIRVT